MNKYTLEIELLSDTAFSMGAGVSGLVDSEIQHDPLGLPTLSGRAIKGLLVNECSEILHVLSAALGDRWWAAAHRLFGARGDTGEESNLYVSDATIAPDLAAYLAWENKLSRDALTDALTNVRHQTAMSERGAPQDESLRAIRVLIWGVTLYAPLIFVQKPTDDEKALLAACVLSLRRAGLGRTRGKGRVRVSLTDRPLDPRQFAETETTTDLSKTWFAHFKQEVSP